MGVTCLLTCEHASNAIPRKFRNFFLCHQSELASHRGYDLGAKTYTQYISTVTRWPLFCGPYSRLLVDLNRNHRPFSPITGSFSEDFQAEIVRNYYDPFRSTVFQWIERRVALGQQVIHFSCHSFTPVFKGSTRTMDVGLLYDPSRSIETGLVESICEFLTKRTSMKIRKNAPYRGVSDGHVTFLRKQFPQNKYVGIEIEVSQSICHPGRTELWKRVWLPQLTRALVEACEEVSLCQ